MLRSVEKIGTVEVATAKHIYGIQIIHLVYCDTRGQKVKAKFD
jgi:hypothetical protein